MHLQLREYCDTMTEEMGECCWIIGYWLWKMTG